jgi:small subunit ribosomal protein S10
VDIVKMQTVASMQTRARAAPCTSASKRMVVAPRVVMTPSSFRANTQALKRVLVAPKAAAIEMSEGEVDEASYKNAMPDVKVKLRIRMRGYDHVLLGDACSQIAALADATGAYLAGPVMLPTKRRIYCVLRSPHVNKDAREHFEVRVHHRLVDLSNLSVEVMSAMMDWTPPAGIEVKCSVV